MGEYDMGTPDIEGELASHPRAAETTGIRLPLKDLYLVPPLVEEPRKGYPRKTPAQDSPSHDLYLRADAIYG